MLRNNNPVFKKLRNAEFDYADSVATYKGVMWKTFFYLLLTVVGAVGGLVLLRLNPQMFSIGLSLSGIFTFIFALIAMISPRSSKAFGSLYCLCEGALIGFISMLFESVVGGVVMASLVATFSVLIVVATLYLSGIVKVNSRFARFTLTLALSVIISQIILYLMSIFMGVQFNFGVNIITSLIMIFLACLYIFMDLQQIVNVVEGGYPKEYEWFVSFGLVFTVLWLYLEILPIVVNIFSDN